METNRVNIRRFQLSDLEGIFLMESDPDVVKYTPMRIPQTRDQSLERLKRTLAAEQDREPLGIWAAEAKDNQDLVGWFMLLNTEAKFTEIGFMIAKKYWARGFATEVGTALVEYAFRTLNLPGLSAITDLDNWASIRVLEKLGFRPIKEITKFDKIYGREIQLRVFGLRNS